MKILHGKPLIFYTINAAVKAKIYDTIILSTNCPEIFEYAKKFPVAPVIRPDYLAADDSSTFDVIMYHTKNNSERDTISLLQPTSPLRTIGDIRKSFMFFMTFGGTCSVVGFREANDKPDWMFSQDEGNNMVPLVNNRPHQRQAMRKYYTVNGAIYHSQLGQFRKNNGFFSSQTKMYLMPDNSSIDIDTQNDFDLAELIMNHK
jgi:CMP-N,N'-diacetyllegionaminic acid synthase